MSPWFSFILFLFTKKKRQNLMRAATYFPIPKKKKEKLVHMKIKKQSNSQTRNDGNKNYRK